MPKFNITPEDMARTKLVEPGDYLMEITKIETKVAKKDQSTNTLVHLKGLEGESLGVPFYSMFNEKAPGFAIPLIKALGGNLDPKKGGTFDISNETCKGKKVIGTVVHSEYEGQVRNNVRDFRPATSGSPSTSTKPQTAGA